VCIVAARGSLDVVYRAVSDSTRRRILELLAQGERSVTELVPRFPMSQPALSQHLRMLREAGLVRVRRQGRRRVYSLRAGPLEEARDWLERIDRMLYGPPAPG
jgi:DNA-binding transcriptional ArsR family regulator